MTFQQLTYFVTAARFGSINQAAEHLYTHQSNISNAVRQLEEEFSIQLFDRNSKGVQLTTAGREFLTYAQDLVRKKENLEQLYQVRVKNHPQHFSVAAMRSFFAYAPLLAILDKHLWNEPMNLRLQKCSRMDVIDLVSRSEADLGILFSMQGAVSRLMQAARIRDVELTPLGESCLHAVMRSGHPLLRSGDLGGLSRYPYVIIENDEDYSRLYDDASGSISDLFSTPPSTIISTNDSMACQSIVANSDAFFISTTPWKHGPHYDFASIPLSGEENRITFYSVIHCGQSLSPLGQEFLESLRQLMQEL
ncbi:LysR family transcriptional regulator [Dysosmobacter sp.]|uniref:LysR family transcriptional regulator n=1 Tax=Dysosmobacter sp. TaxID=2591382 RepID=UPI002671B75D|nr:LysR family transcriptional regulator [Dysosmobacter sp.]MCI7281558.1 LysR family transcriptional regulator [Dysosmobacter sp.]